MLKLGICEKELSIFYLIPVNSAEDSAEEESWIEEQC